MLAKESNSAAGNKKAVLQEPKFSDMICGRTFLGKKFLILGICWCTYMYCSYVTEAFLQYTIGDVFTDTITVANAQALGYALSGYLYVKFDGGKRIITGSLIAAGVLSALMLSVHSEPSTYGSGAFVAILIMGIHTTLSMTMNSLMLVTFTGFPITYIGSVYGVLQIISRVCGLLGPMTAHGSDLIGTKIAFSLLCLLTALIAGLFFEEKKTMIMRDDN